jgi:hypothetical protein
MRYAVTFLCISVASSNALADDLATAQIARARFTTDASPDALQHASCSLDAHVEVAGQSRALDVRVVHGSQVTRCSSQSGLALTVLTSDARDVSVEVEVPDGAPQETVHELSNLVQAIAAEIRRRAGFVQPQAPVQKVAFSPVLTGTGIALAVVGVGVFVAGYIWLLGEIGNLSCENVGAFCIDGGPPALMVAGALAVPLGALLAVVGERRVPVSFPTARLVPWVTPRVGGATAGLSFTF